ncbi:hypothetical protein SAMN04490204_4073 [Pseudomonas thivervalensis]|nr:hypothetical protein SAMN04490204_4073 [Pseudomonas thivervalensis]
MNTQAPFHNGAEPPQEAGAAAQPSGSKLPRHRCGVSIGMISRWVSEKTVGASLLAMAAAQSTSSEADPPLSRASSLPQWACGEHKLHEHPSSLPQRSRAAAKSRGRCAAQREQAPRHRCGVLIGMISRWVSEKPVGASLLAMADGHSTPSLTVQPLSRASSLPQEPPVLYMFPKALNTPIMAGPIATRKKLGHRQKISGKISLVPILAPISSAAWVRRSRNSSA